MKKLIAVYCCLVPLAALSAHRHMPEAPHVSYIFTGPQTGLIEPTNPAEAAVRGSLHGVEGGVGLLVKSLIIAIPTAGYLFYDKIKNYWHKQPLMSHEETRITVQTKEVLARAKYALAITEYVKAHKQLQTELSGYQATQPQTLEEIWQQLHAKGNVPT